MAEHSFNFKTTTDGSGWGGPKHKYDMETSMY
jgi:hypothetical protein